MKGSKTPSRRKFFKAAAATGAAATAAVAMPNLALGAGHITLKMQAAWPSGANIFFEMASDYAKMVSDMSDGKLKIDVQPVGAVVKNSEIGQAVSSGVVDMGHWVTAYWYVKNAAASLFGTGPFLGIFLNYLGFLDPYFDLLCFLSSTPEVSRVPLTVWYLTPGRSFTLPPLRRTTECSCKL